MSDRGLAGFQFTDYRIDQLSLWCSEQLDLFADTSEIPWEWDLQFRLKKPLFYKKIPMYVGGIKLQMDRSVKTPDGKVTPVMRVIGSILGQFPLHGERLPQDKEQFLAKVQIPAILFPYLRSAISSLLVNAGFPKAIVPLINMHHLAQDTIEQLQITEIDDLAPASAR